MAHLSMKRWWGFVLALCFFTGSFLVLGAATPPAALAQSSGQLLPEDTLPPGTGGCGDPDVPLGPGDGVSSWEWSDFGLVDHTVMVVKEARPARDVTASHSVAMKRLRLWLLGLRSLYPGF